MPRGLTIILSSFDNEVKQELGAGKTNTWEQKSGYSWERLGCEGKVWKCLGRVGFSRGFKMEAPWLHLDVKRPTPQMGNPKGSKNCLLVKVWLEFARRWKLFTAARRAGRTLHHGGRMRDSSLIFCLPRTLTVHNRFSPENDQDKLQPL